MLKVGNGIDAYVDGTFQCVPKGFYQCLILMIFDPTSQLYVPVVYCLVFTKHTDAYWHFFDCVILASDRLFFPATITCDFELGLLKAINQQFVENR
jgi:hypothetical protein